jgi:glycosyltransferase involved in cell wall biosynthesis
VSGWFEGCENSAPYAEGCRNSFLGPRRKPACKAVEFAVAAWNHLSALARDADLVIEDFSPYWPVGAYRLQSSGKPVVMQIQNYAGDQSFTRHGPAGLPLFLIEKWYPRLYRNHILVGDHLRERFHSQARTWVIPNGFTMDDDGVAPPATRDYIGFLGRFDFNQKGIDLLLKALAGTNLRVWFAGMGRETDRLKEALRDLPECRLLGAVHGADKWSFLRGARFLALPSRFEGQPIVAIEAAAAGTPILGSSIPVLDFITTEKIGRQFAPFDAAALRRALQETWASGEQLRAWGDAGQKFAAARTWDRIAIDFESTLHAACSRS